MNILLLLIFVSLVLAGGFVLFFLWTMNNNSTDHTDRLALLPLQDDSPDPSGPSTSRSSDSPESTS